MGMMNRWHDRATTYLSGEEAYAVKAMEQTPTQRPQETDATNLFRLRHKTGELSDSPRYCRLASHHLYQAIHGSLCA